MSRKKSCPRSRSLGILCCLAAGLLAPPAFADRVYQISRDAKLLRMPGNEVTKQEQDLGMLYVAESKIRFDHGEKVSWILDAGRSELILVRHDLRRFHVLPVPFELEDFATTLETKAILEDRKAHALIGLEVSPRAEKQTIGQHETGRVDVAGHSPDGENRYQYELWLAPGLEHDAALYAALLREFGSADVMLRPIARKLAEIPGFPVLRRSVAFFPEGKLIDERKLVSVEEKTLAASTYEPPAGYQQQPFDLLDWLTPK